MDVLLLSCPIHLKLPKPKGKLIHLETMAGVPISSKRFITMEEAMDECCRIVMDQLGIEFDITKLPDSVKLLLSGLLLRVNSFEELLHQDTWIICNTKTILIEFFSIITKYIKRQIFECHYSDYNNIFERQHALNWEDHYPNTIQYKLKWDGFDYYYD